MCLLIVLHQVHPEAPLVVAANRDESLARPAVACAVLQESEPRVLGGRDLVAGGTWLSVNEHGVVAGLTNQPVLVRDPLKRSRGELPLALTSHASAEEGLRSFAKTRRPRDYSPAWLLVGDRSALSFVDMSGGDVPSLVGLQPGIHILENRGFGVPSGKVDQVRAALDGIEQARGPVLVQRLIDVLRDHRVPSSAREDDSGVPGFVRPPQTEAACVHAGAYGTRSAAVIVVGEGLPRVWASDGPPCTHPLVERSGLWASPA